MADPIESTSDERTLNNAVRHTYRVLTDEEKAAVQWIKDTGAALHGYFDEISSSAREATGEASRELEIAKQRVEEAVMWAVKHITA